MSWNSPLGIATQHDKARAKADKLRNEADRLDARADELSDRFDSLMAESRKRLEAHKKPQPE